LFEVYDSHCSVAVCRFGGVMAAEVCACVLYCRYQSALLGCALFLRGQAISKRSDVKTARVLWPSGVIFRSAWELSV